jgi:hypothetical protein
MYYKLFDYLLQLIEPIFHTLYFYGIFFFKNGWIFIVLVLLFTYLYIKIKYPFWNIQPVYHRYDYWVRMFYSKPFIMYKHCPIKTKFCDFEIVETCNYLECSPKQISDLINLIQCYYIPSEQIVHSLTESNLNSFLIGGGEPAMVSFYNQKIYDISRKPPVLIDNSDNLISDPLLDITCINTPLACVTSRHVKFYFRESDTDSKYIEQPIYFIDYLCVKREQNIQKISRKLLQTHEYNQRIKNPNIMVSLIKKEIDLFDGVIPLVLYETKVFAIRNIKIDKLPPHFHVTRITAENMDLLIDFIHIQTHYYYQKENPCLFDICIIPEIGSLVELIKNNILYIYCLRRGEQVYGYYFLKDAKTEYEDFMDDAGDAGQTLHCFASVMNCNSVEFFFSGFMHALYNILKSNKRFKIISFEEIGHNIGLIQYWEKRFTPIFVNKTAYYLYNMIFPSSPIMAERTLILL